MPATYSTRPAALRAARKDHGKSAVEGADFRIVYDQTADRYAVETIDVQPAPTPPTGIFCRWTAGRTWGWSRPGPTPRRR
jgi:hypothetical protein